MPLLRSAEQPPLLVLVWESIKRSAGVLVLGVARVLLVKGVDYPVCRPVFSGIGLNTYAASIAQEHASEYGVHWNFFFTLGLIPIVGTVCDRLSRFVDHSWLAVIISSGQLAVLLDLRASTDCETTCCSPPTPPRPNLAPILGTNRRTYHVPHSKQGRNRQPSRSVPFPKPSLASASPDHLSLRRLPRDLPSRDRNWSLHPPTRPVLLRSPPSPRAETWGYSDAREEKGARGADAQGVEAQAREARQRPWELRDRLVGTIRTPHAMRMVRFATTRTPPRLPLTPGLY